MPDEVLTIKEVAALLKLADKTVYAAQAGEIPAFKIWGQWRIKRTELDQRVVKDYTIQGWVMDVGRLESGASVLTDRCRGDRRSRRRRAAQHGSDDLGGRAAGEDPPLEVVIAKNCKTGSSRATSIGSWPRPSGSEGTTKETARK